MARVFYYGGRPSEQHLKRLRAKLDRCLARLLGHGVWKELLELPPESILLVDSLASFDFRGVRVWAAPDLVYHPDDMWVVVDWKTGRAREALRQLAVYALFLLKTLPGEVTLPLRGVAAELGSGEDHLFELGQEEVENAVSEIYASVREMRRLLTTQTQTRQGGWAYFL